jgi:hypothetical protein
MRKLLRELRREFPDATIKTTNGNHYRLVLPNGRTVIVSNSPGDSNFMRQAIADARRPSKKGEQHT